MAFKLTIIGAGSLTFARTLFTDIMHVPELRGIRLGFTKLFQSVLDTFNDAFAGLRQRSVKIK